MLAPAPDAWCPRPLAARDLEAPYTAGLRRLPPKDREALRGRRAAMLLDTRRLSPRRRRRIRHTTVGACVCLPAIAWLLPGYYALADLLFLVPLAAGYGALVGLVRPGPFAGALLLWAWGFLALLLGGYDPFTHARGFVWSYHALFLFLGAAVGAVEDGQQGD